MSWFTLSRWLPSIRRDRDEIDPARLDTRAGQELGLYRWFAGLGAASAEERARDASPETDARVRAAVDSLPVTLFEFDRNGVYTCAAGRYLGVFGVTSAQIVGRSVFEFPRFVPGKNVMVRRALSGETVSFTGIWPLGRYTIRLEPQFDTEGRVASVVGVGFGLAVATQADRQFDQVLEALRQSEARFRAMCDSAPLGIYVSNSKQEIGYVNPALCELLGRRPEELIGHHWQAALDIHEQAGSPVTGTDGGREFDSLCLARKDGSPVWTSLRMAEMRDGGELLGYVGAIADITQERSARLAIDRAQQDLRRVIECSPEGIAIVRDGRWIFVNRAMAEALGYSCPERLLGQSASEIVHPDDRARALELTSDPQPGACAELRCRKAGGDHAVMEVRPAALSEFDGAPAVLITARDITERKKLQAQLLVTERVLSVGTMAAGVAHEINNPLAVVIGNLEWVAGQLGRLCDEQSGSLSAPPAAVRAELQRLENPIAGAREAAGRVRAIARDLKLFSRTEEEREERVELTAVLDSAARMAWNEVRQRARFVREYGELPKVLGSDARLGQVFLNLLINAAQAIPEGHTEQNEICLRARATPTNEVVVEVRDTGCGVAPEIVERIFDPFFTTKPPGIGTGLGLAICHRIVDTLGGRLEVESQPGSGATFRVTLAIADPETRSASQPAGESALPGETRGRVMVIDDDRAMGTAIGLVLGDDHDVEVLTSARGALARLCAGERYDAIVCDVMMPEMSGADFHTALASSKPELASRVIFLTGGAFNVLAREFLDRVPNARLDKPFDSQRLRAMVNRQVSR
jgi:two-component system, cell cycle sensor histidine kinase and response regulator CckA